MSDLHLYVKVLENESTEKSIERTHEIIENALKVYGYSVHEIGENEDLDNEIKAFLSVDTTKEIIYEITSNLSVQLY